MSVAQRIAGFTLIEILVALALVAVALAAGMRALAQAADGAGTLKARTLALWVAQNRLAAIQIAPDALPRATRKATRCRPAWRSCGAVSVGGTPNPAFRRVDIVVAEAAVPDYVLARADRLRQRDGPIALTPATRTVRRDAASR